MVAKSAEGARVGWWLAVDKKLEGEIRTKIAPLSDKVSPPTLPESSQASCKLTLCCCALLC